MYRYEIKLGLNSYSCGHLGNINHEEYETLSRHSKIKNAIKALEKYFGTAYAYKTNIFDKKLGKFIPYEEAEYLKDESN